MVYKQVGQVYSYYYIAFCFPVPKGTVVLVHQYIVFLEACEPVVFMVYKHVGQVDLHDYIAFSFPVPYGNGRAGTSIYGILGSLWCLWYIYMWDKYIYTIT